MSRPGTPAEVALVERVTGCAPTEADIRQIFGRESSPYLANVVALKFPEAYQRLKVEAIRLDLLPPPGPTNLQELIAQQTRHQPAPSEESTIEAEEPKAGAITFEQARERMILQVDNLLSEERLKRERETKG